MQILHVTTSLDPVLGGGTAERTSQLVRALTDAGAVCAVLTLGSQAETDQLEEFSAVRIINLPILMQRYYVPRTGIHRTCRAVRDADVVHLIGHWTVLNAIAYFCARRLRTPYVVCPSGALLSFGRSRRFKLFYNWLVGRRMVHDANHHVAITGTERGDFESYGVPAADVSVIANGVRTDQQLSHGRPGSTLAAGASYVLFVGRLNTIKGPDLLLEAFARAGNSIGGRHLVFVGRDEGLLNSLEASVRAHGIGDRVHFPGPLRGTAKWDAYANADLLVVPSRREAMSIVALEAGVVGTPVLLTDTCGFDEVEKAGGGLVVAPSARGIEAGLRNLLASGTRLEAMGEEMRKLVTEEYTWDRAARHYIEIYRVLVDQAHT